MVKSWSLVAALAVATLAAPAQAWFKKPKCGQVENKPCCTRLSGSPTLCGEGLVCREALCRKCGFEGAPVCDGAPLSLATMQLHLPRCTMARTAGAAGELACMTVSEKGCSCLFGCSRCSGHIITSHVWLSGSVRAVWFF